MAGVSLGPLAIGILWDVIVVPKIVECLMIFLYTWLTLVIGIKMFLFNPIDVIFAVSLDNYNSNLIVT